VRGGPPTLLFPASMSTYVHVLDLSSVKRTAGWWRPGGNGGISALLPPGVYETAAGLVCGGDRIMVLQTIGMRQFHRALVAGRPSVAAVKERYCHGD
jgi:hypothetical protein